ncbi:MAG: hypothetical protein KDI13_00900 [Alphaproteobacteria bacterium]|nr:hypothetical protein [Alphaproteobacteria bacterium]
MAFEIKTDENGDKYLEDRENDIIFRRNEVTGRADLWIEMGFDLIWKGTECRVYAHETHPYGTDMEQDWHVEFEFLPQSLVPELEKIKLAFIEAFKIYGFNFNNTDFKTREVKVYYGGEVLP